LAATILIVSVLQQYYFSSERLRATDQRLETISSSLIASGLSLSLIENLESTDDLVNDLLGEEKVDVLINIYTLDGELQAQNYTASVVPLNFEANERFQTYEVSGRLVRVLNLTRGQLVIQVGLFLNPVESQWNKFFNRRFFVLVALVTMLLLMTSYLGSRILFSPLSQLTVELESMSRQLDRKLGQPLSGFVIGPVLNRLAKPEKLSPDEFEKLCAQLVEFLKKLEDYTRTFNAQTAILTHELKTPLTVLKNYVEEIGRAPTTSSAQDFARKASGEIGRLTAMINDYLQWSVLNSNPAVPAELYAVKLGETVSEIVRNLNAIHGSRIELKQSGDLTVVALPSHMRQLVMNLLSNALTYSPDKVVCEVTREGLSISDRGPGIPKPVLDHLGEPFNRGASSAAAGSGLGLAWIKSLCAKYDWEMKIDSSSQGTKVAIEFPT
jgi:signal transduction histidine kinase